jgi:hypothetical protein
MVVSPVSAIIAGGRAQEPLLKQNVQRRAPPLPGIPGNASLPVRPHCQRYSGVADSGVADAQDIVEF